VQCVVGENGPEPSINIRDWLINKGLARFKNPPECDVFLPHDAPAAALDMDMDIGTSFSPEPPSTAAQFVNTSIVPVPSREDEAPPAKILSPLPRAISPMKRPPSPLKVPAVYGPETEMPLQILQVIVNFVAF
jgi:hypothetical protein